VNPDFVQHINLKIFARESGAIDIAAAIPVFHQWIRNGDCPEMPIDVAEYSHVPAGPGVLLIGHEANYSLDERENRLGLLYNRKAAVDGTFQTRLGQAYRAAFEACERLEKEEAFSGKLKFDRNRMEVFINDRLLAPNNDETWQALQPELGKFFAGFSVERQGECRELFRVAVTKQNG